MYKIAQIKIFAYLVSRPIMVAGQAINSRIKTQLLRDEFRADDNVVEVDQSELQLEFSQYSFHRFLDQCGVLFRPDRVRMNWSSYWWLEEVVKWRSPSSFSVWRYQLLQSAVQSMAASPSEPVHTSVHGSQYVSR